MAGPGVDKLAEAFVAGSRFLDEDEQILLASAVETVFFEKEAGRLPETLSEEDLVLIGAAIAEEILRS